MRILAIQTFPGGSAAVRRHYPYYEAAGADKILGITTEGGGCYWPTPDQVVIGPDSYVRGAHLCQRLIDTIAACLIFGPKEIIVAEYDTLFFHPIPALPPGLTMNPTGGGGPEFLGKTFYHGPWCMGADTARTVVELGRVMIAQNDIEHGWPDRFIGWLAEKHPVPVHSGVFKNYSRNTLDQPEYLAEARAAIAGGAHAVHGVKTPEQLEAITK